MMAGLCLGMTLYHLIHIPSMDHENKYFTKFMIEDGVILVGVGIVGGGG